MLYIIEGISGIIAIWGNGHESPKSLAWMLKKCSKAPPPQFASKLVSLKLKDHLRITSIRVVRALLWVFCPNSPYQKHRYTGSSLKSSTPDFASNEILLAEVRKPFKGMLRRKIEHSPKKHKYEKLGFSEMN